ncbi:uncharacterized protein PV07_09317 [Cladophialophora immunda]|uniref:Uncharacterized protein n=1 Tax=Cladophialophora immunda TaxID=569365 RepID=A0A0D2CRG1_9EURO|nr:uncharacterized protein PV07_09317 [Cladophialophora immunda]KIW26204.1 hypothetical protein PV07_09317 [Cladophialophora immunda]
MSSKRVKRNSAPAQFNRDEDSGGEEEDSGMEIDSTKGQLKKKEENLKKTMAIDVGLRKGQRQQRLEKDFENEFHELEAQIDERVERCQRDT